jgi:hypothetical protein
MICEVAVMLIMYMIYSYIACCPEASKTKVRQIKRPLNDHLPVRLRMPRFGFGFGFAFGTTRATMSRKLRKVTVSWRQSQTFYEQRVLALLLHAVNVASAYWLL